MNLVEFFFFLAWSEEVPPCGAFSRDFWNSLMKADREILYKLFSFLKSEIVKYRSEAKEATGRYTLPSRRWDSCKAIDSSREA